MNYIKQLNYYWDHHEIHSFGYLEVSTYMFLLKYANAKSWRNPLEIRNATILDSLGLKDLRTLHGSRNKLQ